MKITRDGKQIELTINELDLAYCEMRRMTWRSCMDDAINRAESEGNLRYGTMSRDEFLEECTEEMESMYGIEDWDEQCDEVLFDCANSDGIWVDEPWEEDEEDEETAEV